MPDPDMPAPPARPGYRLEFADEFDAPRLDPGKWLPSYLPQWSSRAAAAARYEIGGSALRLAVETDQPPWCPAIDAGVRVSSLQTGVWSGPVGSALGQHRFDPRLIVTEAQEAAQLYVPHYGLIELRAKMELGPRQLAALWLIGFEDRPDDCGEITVMEIKGEDIGPAGTRLVHGIKAIHDQRLQTELWNDVLPLDPGEFHLYAADWSADGVAFYLDGKLLHRTAQSPAYPMQLMLNVYAFEGSVGVPRLIVDYVRGYRRLP